MGRDIFRSRVSPWVSARCLYTINQQV
jgi:hypothetical protein